MISIDESDGRISLHLIRLSEGHLSLTRLTDLSRGEQDKGNVTWKRMLPAMAPNPVFSCARANRSVGPSTESKRSVSDFKCFRLSSVFLFGISPDGGVNLETEFKIPNRSNILWVSGQGRVACVVFQTGFESPTVAIVHLDHPGITLEIRLRSDGGEDLSTLKPHSRDTFEKVESFLHLEGSWRVCFPTPDLAIICGGDRVLAYALPPFSTLPLGKHLLDEEPKWRLSSVTEDDTKTGRRRTSAEVFYDPSPPDDTHFLRQLDCFNPRTRIGLITLDVDPSDSSSSSVTPTYQSIGSRFLTDGVIATGALHPEIYHSRKQTRSEGLEVSVTPLKPISFAQTCGEGESQGSLHMFVSNRDLEPDLEWEKVDLDETSGRVFIWGPTYRWRTPPETRVFLGELVS